MKSTEEKVRFLQAFSETLAQPTFTNDINAKLFSDIRSYTLNMLKVFQHQLQEENNQKWINNKKSEQATINSKSNTSLPKLSNNFSNIDEDVVRKAILSWHNDERNSLGLNLYTYNIDLEGSATTRANKLSDSGKTPAFLRPLAPPTPILKAIFGAWPAAPQKTAVPTNRTIATIILFIAFIRCSCHKFCCIEKMRIFVFALT